ERQLAGIGRRHFGEFEIKVGGGGQPMAFDDVELPRKGAGLLQTDAQRIRSERRISGEEQNGGDSDTEQNVISSACSEPVF
ncbi:MAG: hypothetical protein J0H32_12945, partial [Rhizobiales bacterium]|nr:hypothetical protein [Hyphomicrobiales bacterium]